MLFSQAKRNIDGRTGIIVRINKQTDFAVLETIKDGQIIQFLSPVDELEIID